MSLSGRYASQLRQCGGRWCSVVIFSYGTTITCHRHLKRCPYPPHKLADLLTIGDFYQLWPPAGHVILFGMPCNPGRGIVKRGFGWIFPMIRVILLLFTQPRWHFPLWKFCHPQVEYGQASLSLPLQVMTSPKDLLLLPQEPRTVGELCWPQHFAHPWKLMEVLSSPS